MTGRSILRFESKSWGAGIRFAFCLAAAAQAAGAYSFLTHEAVVDLAWEGSLKPAVASRFPAATGEDLRRAHAFAYGGSVIQDLGYYPFGNKFFSDLTHYARTGDFVKALLSQSQTVDEYAFALGALAHYAGDAYGHPAVNMAVALHNPRIKPQFGAQVTYEQNKPAHLRVELGFDMYQVVQKRYAPDDYRGAVGFEVADELLDRAFRQTYGLALSDVFAQPGLAIGSYRFAISQVLPEITKAAILDRNDQLIAERPGFARDQFLFIISRAAYQREWGKEYRRPHWWARALAFLLRRLPKGGALNALDFVNPTQQTEGYFMESVVSTVRQFEEYVQRQQDGRLELKNWNLDTGRDVAPAEYHLADETYAQLVGRLAASDFSTMDAALKENVLGFYAGSAEERKPAAWHKVKAKLKPLLR